MDCVSDVDSGIKYLCRKGGCGFDFQFALTFLCGLLVADAILSLSPLEMFIIIYSKIIVILSHLVVDLLLLTS